MWLMCEKFFVEEYLVHDTPFFVIFLVIILCPVFVAYIKT